MLLIIPAIELCFCVLKKQQQTSKQKNISVDNHQLNLLIVSQLQCFIISIFLLLKTNSIRVSYIQIHQCFAMCMQWVITVEPLYSGHCQGMAFWLLYIIWRWLLQRGFEQEFITELLVSSFKVLVHEKVINIIVVCTSEVHVCAHCKLTVYNYEFPILLTIHYVLEVKKCLLQRIQLLCMF